MLTYEIIAGYYRDKLWTKAMVWDAVTAPKPKLTKDQYTQITGEPYPEERPEE